MSSKSKPKTLGFVAFGVLLLGAGATYYQYSAVQTKKAEVAALEAEVPSQEELMKSLSDSSAKLDEFRSKLKHLEGSVPDVAYIPTLMKELEQVGLSHNIKVIGVRPAPQSLMAPVSEPKEGDTRPKKKEYEEIEIEVQGRGSYDDVKAFLDALKAFPKVIAVKTVNLEPQRDTNSNVKKQIEAKVSVVAYVFPFEFIPAGPTNATVKIQNTSAAPNEAKAATTNLDGTLKVANKGGQ